MLACILVFQFGGCDPTVRETFLDAFETAVVSIFTGLIQALFQIVQNIPTDTGSGGQTPAAVIAPLLHLS